MKRLICMALACLSVSATASAAQRRIARTERVAVPAVQVREALARPAIRAEITRAARSARFDAARIESHVIRPVHIVGVRSDEGGAERRGRVPVGMTRRMDAERAQAVLRTAGSAGMVTAARPAARTVERRSTLDVAAFTAALHEALKDNVVGYVMELRQNGTAIARLQWNWSRRPTDGGLGWDPDRRMHVASVSKLITAIALVRLLREKHISYDTPIAGYLPEYWSLGSNVDRITFRHLLTHRSGIRVPGSDTDYWTMRSEIAAGVADTAIDHKSYENVNFGLMRILIPVINGDIDRSLLDGEAGEVGNSPSFVDNVWDVFTTDLYHEYVAARVFTPSGVPSSVGFTHPAGSALAYRFPAAGEAWNSGDLRSVSGGAGWVMSAGQVLDVMGQFRRGGGIVPAAVAQEALDAGLGVDVRSETPAGWLYNKNGRWQTSDNHAEQSLAYFLPQNMELVVLANSPISTQDVFFRDLVTTLYENHLR